MSASGRVSRAPREFSAARNCTRDEGGPFEFGDQVPITSHRKLLWSKAMVVSVAETPGQDSGRHGRERRAQANRCRSVESGLGDVRTGGDPSSGISSGDALILLERHPACRRREARPGFRMERENLCLVTPRGVKGQAASGSNREGESTEAGRRGGAARNSVEGPVMGLERRGCVVRPWSLANWKRDEPVDEAKPFKIPKREVWEAFKRVKANQGAAGVDGQSIAEFEANLSGNLYKLWNRLSSGSYFPPPVLRVDIPKADGGTRPLGIPTVADRIGQEVVRRYLEPLLEPVFHADSYGYRPRRSAIEAVRTARQRCWRYDWVVDIH